MTRDEARNEYRSLRNEAIETGLIDAPKFDQACRDIMDISTPDAWVAAAKCVTDLVLHVADPDDWCDEPGVDWYAAQYEHAAYNRACDYMLAERHGL